MPQSRKRRTGKSKRTYRGGAFAPKPAGQPKGSQTAKLAIVLIVVAVIAGGLIYYFLGRGEKEVTTPSGLKYVELVEGTGPSPKVGQTISVHYTGTLQNGHKFDSSRDKGTPYEFTIGRGTVIKGWEEGFLTMKVGGRRKLIVPSKLGYEARGKPPDIPGNATLIFDVELLGIK